MSQLPPQSRIVADLNAVAENTRLGRDGGFVPTRVKPVVWTYDPQMGTSFGRQRVDSRFPNAPTVPRTTSLRRKADRQYLSAEAAKRQIPSTVMSKDGGEVALPGPGRYNVPGTFRRNADGRLWNAQRVAFSKEGRWAEAERALRTIPSPGVGTYKPYCSVGGEWF
jgi:hypothetical protein